MSQPAHAYVVLVKLSIKPDHAQSFKDAMLHNARQSLALEPDCWVFDVAADEGGTEYCLYEVYKDAAAFDHHLQCAHFLAFDKATAPWLEAKTVQRFWRIQN